MIGEQRERTAGRPGHTTEVTLTKPVLEPPA